MISRFINRFKRTDGDEQRAFQLRVLAILRDLYRDRVFSVSDDPLALNMGAELLGLTNIRSAFLLTTQSDSDLRTIVAEHFGGVWSNLDLAKREAMDWETARPLVMPQLVPEEFLEKLPLAASAFGGGVVAGIVIDSEKAYSYVTADDLKRWGVDKDEVYTAAVENLGARSTGLEATVVPQPNGFIVVSTLDSFDAARILLADLRAKFADFIGSPFYFGVPNRDFLICWSKSGDNDFQQRMRSQVSQDCDERPYPLSPHVFEAGGDGEIRMVELSGFDPRAAIAERN